MDGPEVEFSILLWALGVLVAMLALHLAQAWVRKAQRHSGLLREWRALTLASVVLAAGLTAAAELGLQAQAFSFAVGYRWLAVALLLPGAVLLCAPVVVLSAWSTRPPALVAAGALLAGAALALGAGWIWAAGFRPGVYWRLDFVAAAAVLLLVGLVLAQWMAHGESIQASARREWWRVGGAGLAALTLLGGQQLLTLATGLHSQGASQYVNEMPGTVLSLVTGVLVPLALVALMLDLWLRRQQRRQRRQGDFNPTKRRKRRHKMRTL